MSIINAVINGIARNGDTVLHSFVANSGNMDNLVAAIRGGNLDSFLRNTEGAAALANNPLFMRTMAKLGDNIRYLDEVENALVAGRAVNPEEFLARLGVNAGDDVAVNLTRGLANYNDVIAAGARSSADVTDRLAALEQRLDSARPPRATVADYSTVSASTGFRHLSYGVLRSSADWFMEKGILGQVAGGGLRVAAGTVRWGVPVLGTALVGVVGANYMSGGDTTRAIADAANGTLDWTANQLQATSPETAAFLRQLGPDAGEFLLQVMSQPVDTASQFIQQTARYRGLTLSEEQANSLAQFLNGNPLMAALTAGGYNVDPQEMIRIYRESTSQADPAAYVQRTLQQRLGLTDAQMAEYVQRGEELRSGAGQMVERLRGYQRELGRMQSLAGEGLTTEFNRVVQNNNLNLFSSVSMFLATVLDFLGLNSLADHFKRSVVVDATISQFGDRFNLTGARAPNADPRQPVVDPALAPQ